MSNTVDEPREQLHDIILWVRTALELQASAPENEARLLSKLIELDHRRHGRESGPLFHLARILNLSTTEQQIVETLLAASTDSIVRRLIGQRSDSRDGEPTLDTLKSIVYGDGPSPVAFGELGTGGTLLRFGILERTDFTAHARGSWALSRVALKFLFGLKECVDGTTFAVPHEIATTRDVYTTIRDAVCRRECLTLVCGAPGAGRRSALLAAARDEGFEVQCVDARKLPTESASFCKQLRELALECALRSKVPLITNLDALGAEQASRLSLLASEFMPLISTAVLATCGVNRPALTWDRPTIVIDMGQPTSGQRAQLWHQSLGQGTAEDAQLLADQYPLAPALIVRAAEAAKARAGERELEPEDIYAGIRTVLDDRLGQYAKRVTVTQTWDDLVLPQEQTDCIIELMARIRQRRTVYEKWGFAAKVGKGLGVSALFSGPPGTGKTMVAALIARDLGLELYQVDMAKVVSKFIGETEKNLGALFDAAEAGHAILLFDEADALFGKRTDVKSSNDRYANLETNYLLQRLESFTGICLLTSNHESHIDPAFQRRLSLHLRFEVPDADERALLWRATLPAAAPVAPNVDFVSLGRRFAMSGGYIRNAALRAAFLAADEDSEITAAHLERAARVEYEGMGKIAA